MGKSEGTNLLSVHSWKEDSLLQFSRCPLLSKVIDRHYGSLVYITSPEDSRETEQLGKSAPGVVSFFFPEKLFTGGPQGFRFLF